MSQIKTLAEAMAIAVLKGDMAAAYALVDKLQEDRDDLKRLASAQPVEQRSHAQGFDVYHWPEFQAFARRLGFKWDLSTIECTITLRRDELVMIDHVYVGANNPPPAIDTTTLHNQTLRTFQPNHALGEET